LEQELGARELAARAWKGASSNRAVEAGAGPKREQEWDPGKHLSFFFLFLSLFLLPVVELRSSSTKKATPKTPSPSSSLCCQKKKEATAATLLLPSFFVFFMCCAAVFFFSCALFFFAAL
jgi:hypothetical protein